MLVARQPVDAASRCGSEQQPVVHEVLLDRGDGAEHPRVVAGEEPDERERQQDGVDLGGVVVLGEGAALGVEALGRGPRRAPRRAGRATGRPGPSSPCSSTARTARSKATHTMTREWVKCRSGPRISQSPLSGCVPVGRQLVDQGALQGPASAASPPGRRRARARARSSPRRARRSGAAPTAPLPIRTGRRPGVPGQVRQLALGQLASAVDGVHDLQVLRGRRRRRAAASRASCRASSA